MSAMATVLAFLASFLSAAPGAGRIQARFSSLACGSRIRVRAWVRHVPSGRIKLMIVDLGSLGEGYP